MNSNDHANLKRYQDLLQPIITNIWDLKLQLDREYDLLPEIDQQNEPGEDLHRESCYLEDIHAHLEEATDYISRLTGDPA